MGGGALQPIAQSVLLESFPPAKRGAAMALYGMGVVVRRSSARRWAAGSRTIIRGGGSFTSICRSVLVAAFMANTFVEDPPYLKNQKPGRIDYIGFGLMALGWLLWS